VEGPTRLPCSVFGKGHHQSVKEAVVEYLWITLVSFLASLFATLLCHPGEAL